MEFKKPKRLPFDPNSLQETSKGFRWTVVLHKIVSVVLDACYKNNLLSNTRLLNRTRHPNFDSFLPRSHVQVRPMLSSTEICEED